MNKLKTTFTVLALILIVVGLHACGGGGSGSGDNQQSETPQVYSLTLTDIGIVRTAGRQPVPVGPLPAGGAQVTVE